MVQIADALGLTLRELLESMETRRATPMEAARLFEEAPKEVQQSILDVLRSVVPKAANSRGTARRRPKSQP